MSETTVVRPRGLRWEPLTVGIDIGGTKVLAAVVDPVGHVVEVARRPTQGHDVKLVEDTIVDLVTSFAKRHDVGAVGIGAAGFVDATRTTVMFSPHLNWRREPLRARVAERVRLPVVVDNDANMMGLAESRFGAGRGLRSALFVTLGTCIGGGVSDAGDLLLDPVRRAFSRGLTGRGHREEPVIVRAELGSQAGMIGAADMARSAARRSRRGRARQARRDATGRRRLLPLPTEPREPREPLAARRAAARAARQDRAPRSD
jgi:glucokinase